MDSSIFWQRHDGTVLEKFSLEELADMPLEELAWVPTNEREKTDSGDPKWSPSTIQRAVSLFLSFDKVVERLNRCSSRNGQLRLFDLINKSPKIKRNREKHLLSDHGWINANNSESIAWNWILYLPPVIAEIASNRKILIDETKGSKYHGLYWRTHQSGRFSSRKHFSIP